MVQLTRSRTVKTIKETSTPTFEHMQGALPQLEALDVPGVRRQRHFVQTSGCSIQFRDDFRLAVGLFVQRTLHQRYHWRQVDVQPRLQFSQSFHASPFQSLFLGYYLETKEWGLWADEGVPLDVLYELYGRNLFNFSLKYAPYKRFPCYPP